MKTRRIFIFCFSLLVSFAFAQNEDLPEKKWKYEPNFMVGVDLLNGSIGIFSERQLFQGFVSSRIKKNLHAVAEAGFDKNFYQKNGYDAKVNGPFFKLGLFYMLAKDRENEFNGFYGGMKLGGAFYNQEYFSIPVRGYGGSVFSESYPASSQSSYWLEATLGGRVQLFDTHFFIDVNLQPRYMMFTTKQDGIYPMIVPGFGKSSGKFNMGFAWNIAYKF